MDVSKVLLGLAFLLTLSACSGSKTSSSVFEEKASQCSGESLQNKFIVQWEDGSFTTEYANDVDEFKRGFIEKNLERIRKVEYDRVVTLENPIPSAGEMDLPAKTWGQTMIHAASAWDQGYTGQGVLVGVVDSTVDITHRQLAGQIAINAGEIPGNGIDDDNNGYIDDVYGYSFITPSSADSASINPHGSHVSGIIAADPTAGPVHGIAPGARLIPAPFISNSGSGSIGDAILAMQYTASRGAKVVNASWGGAPCVSSLKNALVELGKKGVIVVVAAGNDSLDLDRYPTFPAAFGLANQITVAASNVNDFMTAWSNSSFNLTHLAAPGESIYSTVPVSYKPEGTDSFDGTSMATPFVTGTIALLWSVRPQATADQVKQALLTSVDVTPNHEFRVSTRGRLNVEKAIQNLKRLVP